MVKLEGFLTAYKDTLISCTWKAEKAVVQAQAIITGILKSHTELNWSLAILAHQGQGPDQDQVGPALEVLQSLDVSEPTGRVEVAHSSLLKITIPPQFNLKIMKRPLPSLQYNMYLPQDLFLPPPSLSQIISSSCILTGLHNYEFCLGRIGTVGRSCRSHQHSLAAAKGVCLGLDPDVSGSRVPFGNGKFIDL